MLAGETLLRLTRRYTVIYVDGRRVDVDAEGMWPVSNALEFVVTVSVIGIPRQGLARRALLGRVGLAVRVPPGLLGAKSIARCSCRLRRRVRLVLRRPKQAGLAVG